MRKPAKKDRSGKSHGAPSVEDPEEVINTSYMRKGGAKKYEKGPDRFGKAPKGAKKSKGMSY